jgi:undecaprenyl-diphosphatase
LVCSAALLLSRVIVKVFLPFRVRPLCDATSGLHFPAGTTDWQNWSSFPSDHAILFFTLTVGLFSISRLLGWIALLDTVFLICLPRLYLGIHYPTDVIAGAVIGVAAGFIARDKAVGICLAKWPLQWVERQPGLFYAVFFVFMYQMAVMFWDVRLLGSELARVLVKLLR